ncbi:MAG: OmpA family protein, partial [Bacteroidia bacterium]|nr:OmpA family protein [Bacteroidia bacterium]
TSEDKRGSGGLDIYQSTKGADGEWGAPENLGNIINTPFDEDAPFLSADGQTLYFASKGHPGYGNYDIYKSKLINGQWSVPENLNTPVNSSGDDIFLVHTVDETNSYFSSYRSGGFGDMDIYKITYLDKFKKECTEKTNSLLSIESKLVDEKTHLVNFTSTLSQSIKAIAYQWTFNQTKLPNDASQISQNVSNTETGDSVYVKVIAGCDTCIEPIVLCNFIKYQKPKEEIIATVAEESGKNPYDDKLILAYLSKSKIAALGFNLTPVHFNLNKSNLRKDAVDILKTNVDVLAKHPEISVLIYGFADSRGSEAHNLPLSKKRAKEVKDYLISKGVKSSQIEQVNGKGETFILNQCTEGVTCEDTEHEVNRRVEFILFEKK